MNKTLNEFTAHGCASFLLQEHSIGGFRDEGDLNNSKYHSYISINLALDMLGNIEGSIEDKIQFLKNSKEDIEKFHIKIPTE